MMKRKYPWSVFFIGVIFSLINPLFIAIAIIFALCMWLIVPEISLIYRILASVVVLIILAVIKQLNQRNIMLNMNLDDSGNRLLDKMFADNE